MHIGQYKIKAIVLICFLCNFCRILQWILPALEKPDGKLPSGPRIGPGARLPDVGQEGQLPGLGAPQPRAPAYLVLAPEDLLALLPRGGPPLRRPRRPGVVLVAVEEEEQAVRRVRLPRPSRDAHGRSVAVAVAKRNSEIVVTPGALCGRGARRWVEHDDELRRLPNRIPSTLVYTDLSLP